MISSEDTSLIIPALVKTLATMTDVRKRRTADLAKYSYKFADLKDVLTLLRPLLNANGLAVMQTAHTHDNGTAVTTTILHTSGQWIESAPLRMPAGSDSQSHGSAITFARRYSLMSMLGLATEDDDGKTARPTPAKSPADALYERVRASAGTPVADELKAAAAENSMKLTANAFRDDEMWFAIVTGILDGAR